LTKEPLSRKSDTVDCSDRASAPMTEVAGPSVQSCPSSESFLQDFETYAKEEIVSTYRSYDTLTGSATHSCYSGELPPTSRLSVVPSLSRFDAFPRSFSHFPPPIILAYLQQSFHNSDLKLEWEIVSESVAVDFGFARVELRTKGEID